MLVRCIQSKASYWSTEGKIYRVLEIHTEAQGIKYRLLGDEGDTPVLFSGADFELIEGAIPDGWSCLVKDGGRLVLAHQLFQTEGYWEKFFQGEQQAWLTFRRLTRQLGLIHLHKDWMRRCPTLPWATAVFLYQQFYLSVDGLLVLAQVKAKAGASAGASEGATAEENKSSDTERAMAALTMRDSQRILDHAHQLAALSPDLDEDAAGQLLLAWAFEHWDVFDDPLQAVEELAAKFFKGSSVSHLTRVECVGLSKQEIFSKWHSYLEAEVYGTRLERMSESEAGLTKGPMQKKSRA